jgi:antirestriction protein
MGNIQVMVRAMGTDIKLDICVCVVLTGCGNIETFNARARETLIDEGADHTTQEYIPFIIVDNQDLPDQFVDDGKLTDDVWDFIQDMEDFGEFNDYSSIITFIDVNGYWDKEAYESRYQGQFDSPAQLAQDQCADNDIPSWLVIDWERTGNNLMQDYSESDGHYFRR